MEHKYVLVVDNNDPRPEAGKRIGLEIARALHYSAMPGVHVFMVEEGTLEVFHVAIAYDPKEPVVRQMGDDDGS